jgi:hypothetical protein
MSEEQNTGSAAARAKQASPASDQPAPKLPHGLLELPALVAISLYLLALAGVIILGVVSGRHYPPIFLVLSAAFIAASAGLLLLLRWAWAAALSAVFLLACYNLWVFSTQHVAPSLVQGLLNLVFFLYLVRAEVREKLR